MSDGARAARAPRDSGVAGVAGVDDVELRALLDETSELVIAASAAGRVTYANRAWRETLGYTLSEALELDVEQLLAPGQLARFRDAMRQLERGERVEELELVLLTRGSRRIVCRGRAIAVVRSGRYIASRWVFQDVTAERQASALRGRLAATLEATSDLVGIATREGNVVYVNRAGRRMLGLTDHADLSAMRVDDLFAPGTFERLAQDAVPIVLQQGHWEGESVLLGASGEEIPVSMVVVAHPSLRPDEPPFYLSAVMRDVRERVRAERALRDSEARLRAIVEALDEGVLITDFDDRVVFVNQRLCQMARRAPDEIVGRHAFEVLLPPDQHEAMRRRTADRRGGAHERYELEMLRADGSRLWVEIGAAPFSDGTGVVVGTVGSVTDISARRDAEAALRSAEKLQRELLSALPLVVYDVEPTAPFAPLYVSPGVTTLGWTLEQWMARPDTWVAALHPDDRDRVLAQTSEAMRENRSVDYEYRLLAPDGTVRWVHDRGDFIRDAHGEPIAWRGILLDVTARQAAEAALRESEERFRTVLENLRAVAVALDDTGHVTFANEYLLSLTGWSRADVVGADWFERFVPAGAARRARYASMLAEDALPSHYESDLITRAGARRWIAWDNVTLRDVRGRAIGTASVGRDITEERRVRELKDQLIATVSHELRSPLTAIRGGLQLLPRLVPSLAGQARELVDMASRNTERLIRLTNDLLDVERVESGMAQMDPIAVDAQMLIASVCTTMRHVAESAHVELQAIGAHHGDPRTTAWADVDRITQVLTNLIGNAIKFSPPGGRVRVRADAIDGAVRFSVLDQGRGMPGDKLDAIFERFVQLEPDDARVQRGAGLGLAISRAIVVQHGGRIWAESTVGQGSQFYFTLPSAESVLAR